MIKTLILSVVGLACVYLEFFLPGGIIGSIGGALLLVALGLFIAGDPSIWQSLLCIGSGVVALAAVIGLAIYQIKAKKGSLSLEETQEGYAASAIDLSFVGKRGQAATDLKPAGTILVEGNLYEALSESGYLSKQASVTIIGGRGSYYIIRECDDG